MKLTIIIPVFNEEKTIGQCIKNVASVRLPKMSKEIIVVNDGSTDGTLGKIRSAKGAKITVIDKAVNKGKGAAIRSALKIAKGDVFIIQDADLEYNPSEYKRILTPIIEGQAEVVFGSRFIGSYPHRVLYFWHMMGNKLLTLLTNAVTNLNLTDMETCYKAFTTRVARRLDLQEYRFGFEPEFTAKVARMGVPVYEVGISYSGRSYSEGKKINWKDGVEAVMCLVKYGVLPIYWSRVDKDDV